MAALCEWRRGIGRAVGDCSVVQPDCQEQPNRKTYLPAGQSEMVGIWRDSGAGNDPEGRSPQHRAKREPRARGERIPLSVLLLQSRRRLGRSDERMKKLDDIAVTKQGVSCQCRRDAYADRHEPISSLVRRRSYRRAVWDVPDRLRPYPLKETYVTLTKALPAPQTSAAVCSSFKESSGCV